MCAGLRLSTHSRLIPGRPSTRGRRSTSSTFNSFSPDTERKTSISEDSVIEYLSTHSRLIPTWPPRWRGWQRRSLSTHSRLILKSAEQLQLSERMTFNSFSPDTCSNSHGQQGGAQHLSTHSRLILRLPRGRVGELVVYAFNSFSPDTLSA